MDLTKISAGDVIPDAFNVIIEIAAHDYPIKYEIDKASGTLVVDRLLSTSMHYPCNYGFIPHSLAEDGDPTDVLVVSPYPLLPGAMICCRAVGLLRMSDESGIDAKVLAVPVSKITMQYDRIVTAVDLGQDLLNSIKHFFMHYKDLDNNKWVKIAGWDSVAAANQEIMLSIERYKTQLGL
jgi:inorganic pyrophosphatase